MIKFFRHIRKELMETGKTGRYFKYAIGEIILVVIGILIALQINNWNENRKDNKLEANYKLRLLEDLKEEEAYLQTFMDYNTQVIFHAKKAIKLFENPGQITNNPNQDLIDLYQASQIIDGNSTTSTYQELIASGQINLIRNDNLRTSIISYFELDWANSLVFGFTNPYRDNLRRNMPNEIQEKIRSACGDRYKPLGRSIAIYIPTDCKVDVPYDISRPILLDLLKDSELKKDLRFLIGNTDAKIEYMKTIIKQLNGLNALLEANK
jgi:hypothetical protein